MKRNAPRPIVGGMILGLVLLLTVSTTSIHAQGTRKGGRGVSADALRARLEPVLRLTDAEITRRIPNRSGFFFVDCPNCDAGAEEGQLAWTFDRPDEVYCRYCQMRFPNERFPENQVLQVKNARGEIQDYPYWEAPDPPPRGRPSINPKTGRPEGYRHFFTARAWYYAREYFARAVSDLARLYQLTGERDHARRAALILDRFAQVYPGYCARFDYPFTQKRIFPGDQGHPYPVSEYRAAKWSWWGYMDVPDDLMRAYEVLRTSGEINAEMKHRIEDDFFRATVAFIRGYEPTYSNMDPTLLRSLIVAGKVLGDPGQIHDVVAWIEQIVARQFFADGMWREGTVSYHNQTFVGLRILIEQLNGYSDPPGYRHPKDGTRYDKLDLAGRFPILEKARTIPEQFQYPNGRAVVIHDTWSNDRGSGPTTATGPLLLPAFGHARLGSGRDQDQLQAHLHFSGGYGHQHADLLSITLFALGNERLSDLGYSHTRYRSWAAGTLAHNTVMVNGREQDTGSESRPNDGALTLYIPGDSTFQAVEAAAPRAYPGITRDYRRMLNLVGIDPGRTYVVDTFHVIGGDRHEYALMGDADHDGAIETDLPRQPHGANLLPAGVKASLPTGENVGGSAEGHNIAYAFVRDVTRARAPDQPWTAQFTSQATPRGLVRVHGLPQPETDVFLAHAPSVRRAGSDDSLVDRFNAPMLIQRREGRDLSSTFATVLEPYADRPFLQAVERLPLDAGDPGDLALKVQWDGGADYLLIAHAVAGSTIRSGNITLRGRLGFIRERAGRIERMVLVNGTDLQFGSQHLIGNQAIRGNVVGTLRRARGDVLDGLIIADALPANIPIKGRTVIVSNRDGFTQGHEIVGNAEHQGRPVLVLANDPAFEIDAQSKSQAQFFPRRSWDGANSFEIAEVTTRDEPNTKPSAR